jgi:Flp pilus assembly protein TadD
MIGHTGTHMQEVGNNRLADLFRLLIPAALGCAALAIVSCAGKTAAVRPVGFFTTTPIRQTTNAVDAGDSDMEIASLRRAMTSRPDDVDVRLRLAEAYASHGFADVALEHYRLAAERFPGSLQAALRLARTLRKAGQKEEALAGLKAFIHANPQITAEPYEWLGILNDDLQRWKDSQLAYETALLYSPSSAELHNNLGYALMMQHLNNSAATEFRAALRLQRNLAIARNNLGIALSENPKEAILNWQSASDPATAHNNMAALLIERGDLAGARKELETALGYDRQNGPAIYNLALVSERDGKPAVLPGQPGSKTSKPPNALAKFFHPGRYSATPTDPGHAPVPSVSSKPVGKAPPPAEAAVVPTSSGSGN